MDRPGRVVFASVWPAKNYHQAVTKILSRGSTESLEHRFKRVDARLHKKLRYLRIGPLSPADLKAKRAQQSTFAPVRAGRRFQTAGIRRSRVPVRPSALVEGGPHRLRRRKSFLRILGAGTQENFIKSTELGSN